MEAETTAETLRRRTGLMHKTMTALECRVQGAKQNYLDQMDKSDWRMGTGLEHQSSGRLNTAYCNGCCQLEILILV
jgi:hypothetical protein